MPYVKHIRIIADFKEITTCENRNSYLVHGNLASP